MPERGDRTESATPKRRREAREKGQVAKSTDLSPAVVMLAVVLTVNYIAPFMYDRVMSLFTETFTRIPNTNVTVDAITSLAMGWVVNFLTIMGPIFALAVITALVINYAQVGVLFTTKPLNPDFSKLNPIKGTKRIFSSKAFAELLKSLFKLLIVGYISFVTIKANYPLLVNLADMELTEILKTVASIIYFLSIRMGMALLFLAIIDYFYQRFDFERNLRMTKQEIKDEMKQQEGDPMIKARQRQRQRQVAMQRMMQEVPKADVIITNPTHLAIALEYSQEDMTAPKVLAKGQRLIAEKIKKIAKEHGIPVVEDKPVARWLFKSAQIGSEIPVELYQAVAEILAMIYKTGKKAQEMRVSG